MKSCAVLVSLLALITVPGASAKAPPDGYRLCGPTRCFLFGGNDAEVVAINMFSNSTQQLDTGQPVKPFWVIHWQWPGEAEKTAFYVPGAFRMSNKWFAVGASAQQLLTRAAIDIEPFAATPPARVTVGDKPVRDPASYAVLWTTGKPTYAWRGGWIRVRLYTDAPSPWRGSVAVSQRGSLLLRDDTVFKISAKLAARVRARVSLR